MNYVEKITTLPKEESTKSIIDVLNSKALDSLGNVDESLGAFVSSVATLAAKARDLKRLAREKLGIEAGERSGTDKLVHTGVNKLIDHFKTP